MTEQTPSRTGDATGNPTDDGAEPQRRSAFDTPTGYSGQDYHREREAAEGERFASGHPLTGDPASVTPPATDTDGRNIPPENGRRGWIDPATGEVHGSGAGAGGGNEGETFEGEGTAGS
jgi:hypothetical protein